MAMGLVLHLLVLTVIVFSTTAFQCVDENNNPVDWFVVYKIPKVAHHPNKIISSGLAYSVITSTGSPQWTLSEFSLNDSRSILGTTLSVLYQNVTKKSDSAYILYNDQPPNAHYIPDKGHTKGVIWADPSGGFWLVHSVPHFPIPGTDYQYPKTGTKFGQSFLCLSLDLENLNKASIQLQYNQIHVYLKNIPTDKGLSDKIVDLVNAANNKIVESPPWFHRSVISTRGGVGFVSFAKSGEFGKELYEDLVAPALLTDLMVETWPNGVGKLISNCSRSYKVYNIKTISIKVADVVFNTTHDHSKWAVSRDNGKNWICIGDINRMDDQKVRGGGTVCLHNKVLSDNYFNTIKSIEECPKNH